MLEDFYTWQKHFESIVDEKVTLWKPSSIIDLNEGNPILALYNPSTFKAIRILKGFSTDRESYGMWVKRTSIEDLPDDCMLEYVFKYREVNNSTFEAFRIFSIIWMDDKTDYDYMKCLIEKFQKPINH